MSLGACLQCEIIMDSSGIPNPPIYTLYWGWFLSDMLDPYSSFDSGIAVEAGDQIQILVCVGDTFRSGIVFATNVTQSAGSSMAFLEPPVSGTIGDIAHWFVEREDWGGDPYPLPNFQYVTFNSANASTPTSTIDPASGIVFNLTDYGSPPQVVSAGSIVGPETVTGTYNL